MKYKIKVRSIWEFGQRKDSAGNPHQEDSLFPLHGEAKESDRLFILCDGMGGHEAGEVASSTVCESMANYIISKRPDAEGPFEEEDINGAVEAAYVELDAKDTGSSKKMGTTMTMLKFWDGGYYAAHMGDSRIYHIRPGHDESDTTIIFRTEDHSLVNTLVKIGEITPEEAKTHRHKNVITRAMQPGEENRDKADIHKGTDIKEGDWFYMCSDGMLEHMDDDNLKWIFSDEGGDIDRKAENLREATKENRDNHTAFIIRIEKVKGTLPESESLPKPNLGETREQKVESKPKQEGIKANRSGKRGKRGIRGAIFILLVIIIAAILFAIFGKEKEETKPEENIEKFEPGPKQEKRTPEVTQQKTEENLLEEKPETENNQEETTQESPVTGENEPEDGSSEVSPPNPNDLVNHVKNDAQSKLNEAKTEEGVVQSDEEIMNNTILNH